MVCICLVGGRITELEQSERNLLLQFSQLAAAASCDGCPGGAQHARRLDQKLHTLRDEVRTMVSPPSVHMNQVMHNGIEHSAVLQYLYGQETAVSECMGLFRLWPPK